MFLGRRRFRELGVVANVLYTYVGGIIVVVVVGRGGLKLFRAMLLEDTQHC